MYGSLNNGFYGSCATLFCQNPPNGYTGLCGPCNQIAAAAAQQRQAYRFAQASNGGGYTVQQPTHMAFTASNGKTFVNKVTKTVCNFTFANGDGCAGRCVSGSNFCSNHSCMNKRCKNPTKGNTNYCWECKK